MEPSKSDPLKDNRPETNVPRTGTISAPPGKPLSHGELGDLNSVVVAPYGLANLGPERASPDTQIVPPKVQPQGGPNGPQNDRPAVMAKPQPEKK